jgi:hypothetical protein
VGYENPQKGSQMDDVGDPTLNEELGSISGRKGGEVEMVVRLGESGTESGLERGIRRGE